MHLLCVYTVKWETEARRSQERSIEARRVWLSRQFQQAAGSTRREARPRPVRATLRRLVSALGNAGQ
jgi:hypothetical protein